MADFSVLETKSRILEDNDRVANELRGRLREKGVFLLNLMGSPGAGKTSTLLRTIEALKDEFRIGVMEADVDDTVDAETVAESGVRVIQLHTGGSCHMDADMTGRGLEGLGLEGLDLVILENVGNLVCPAEFDIGQAKRAMILSVPEGDDKPLKYPLMFTVSDALIINKIDTAPVFDFDEAACRTRAEALNPDIAVFPLSARTGEGVAAWTDWLRQEIISWRMGHESH